ncbi:MAG: hypothetical protein AAF674_00905 [Pseudomonadota bacterium]
MLFRQGILSAASLALVVLTGTSLAHADAPTTADELAARLNELFPNNTVEAVSVSGTFDQAGTVTPFIYFLEDGQESFQPGSEAALYSATGVEISVRATQFVFEPSTPPSQTFKRCNPATEIYGSVATPNFAVIWCYDDFEAGNLGRPGTFNLKREEITNGENGTWEWSTRMLNCSNPVDRFVLMTRQVAELACQ